MKERPILFSGAMVRAILEGRKTQTRRVVRLPKGYGESLGTDILPTSSRSRWVEALGHDRGFRASAGHWNVWSKPFFCPYGVPGDRLWVRETWQIVDQDGEADASDSLRHRLGTAAPFRGCQGERKITWRAVYRADGEAIHPEYGPIVWRPSIHMPRWASRLLMEVKAVRVERLREISQDDAQREGMRGPLIDPELDRIVNQIGRTPRECFGFLWDSINAKRGHSWESNPWVWVVEFERVAA